MMKKRPYTLWIYWEDEVKLGTHHTRILKFNTVEEATNYARALDQDIFDWAVFTENDEIVADKGEDYLGKYDLEYLKQYTKTGE